jgi:mRNA interferase HicA
MKRRELIKHLEAHGCHFVREGAGHSHYRNSKNGQRTTVPRHREIKEPTAADICKQLGIPRP